jgi:amidase
VIDAFASALSVARAIRGREVSPVEVADFYLARIDRLDPTLNAFCYRDDERVQAWARQAEDQVARSLPEDLPPFCGVPLPIKDLAAVEGWPTTYGSRGASGQPNVASDPVVQRLCDAGFIPLGMTNSPELGTVGVTESLAHGATRNPWNPEFTPGGSSGGAGAAVAAGLAPAAHGSDGAGSLRIPASCCGLIGFKASRARIPNLVLSLEGFATAGAITRDVADTAALLDVLSVVDPLAWYAAPPSAVTFAQAAEREPRRLRIGVLTTPLLPLEVAPACLDAVEATARVLEALGHEIEEVTLPSFDADALLQMFGAIWCTGTAGAPVDVEKLEPLNATLRRTAKGVDSISYVQAVQGAQVFSRRLVSHVLRSTDVLLTPTMSIEPPAVGAVWAGADEDPMAPFYNGFPLGIFTLPWNVTGLPAASYPVYQAASGLPVGVQVVGGPWREDLVLQVGRQLEQAMPWAGRHAPLALP